MRGIRRGSTPTLRFKTPFKARLIKGGFITFTQRGITVIDKELLTDSSVTVDDYDIIVRLTQAETLKFTTVDEAKVQVIVKFQGDKQTPSNIVKLKVFDILKEGEI